MARSNKDKIILDLYGGSGAWSEFYRKAGYTVLVITLPEYDVTDTLFSEHGLFFLMRGEDRSVFVEYSKVHGILAAPPCTVFSKADWKTKKIDRRFNDGMVNVRVAMNIIWTVQEHGAPLAFWALENPQGYLYNFLGQPAFWFQPWMFGDTSFTATKRTAIWGYFNRPVKTRRKRTIPFVSPHSSKRDVVAGKPRNKGWTVASAAERAVTPAGFAKAFFEANP